MPCARARCARSKARCQTFLLMGNSGRTREKSLSTFFSWSPRAPFHSSSCTISHQQASPLTNAASTFFRTCRSPSGRSKCIQDDVSTRITSTLSAHRLKLWNRDQVSAGAGILGQFGHALPPVEIRDCSNHCFALGLRSSKPDGIRKLGIGNINCRFHASKIPMTGILIKWFQTTRRTCRGMARAASTARIAPRQPSATSNSIKSAYFAKACSRRRTRW